MGMTKDQIKQLILERVMEARIYGDPYRTSDEYELSPEEISAIKNMDHKQRMNFALKKLKIARREKGQCISGGPKCSTPPAGPDGKPGPYCQKHLESFRVARARLAKKRGSCTRCPNPPIPGKKLCQNCTDELEMTRLKALDAGLCIRCKKKPMELNKHGEKMLFCRGCIDDKVAWNKQRKNFKKSWQDYANDVIATTKDRQRKPIDDLQEAEINLAGDGSMDQSYNWKLHRSVSELPPDRKDWGPEDWSVYMDSLSTKTYSPTRRAIRAKTALNKLQNPEPRKQRTPSKPKSRWRNLRHVLKRMLRNNE